MGVYSRPTKLRTDTILGTFRTIFCNHNTYTVKEQTGRAHLATAAGMVPQPEPNILSRI